MCFFSQSMIDYLIRFAACRKSWILDALPGRLGSGGLDAQALNAWTLNFGRLDAWARDAWTLELGTSERLDFGQQDFGRLDV